MSGLERGPYLNGVKGTAVGDQVERWKVKLDTGEELALRSANLQAGSTEMLGSLYLFSAGSLSDSWALV